MTDLIRSMCWPYSTESFATCLFAYLRPENTTSGVRFSFTNFLSLAIGEDLFKSGYDHRSEDITIDLVVVY